MSQNHDTPKQWIEDLDRSLAEIASGQTFPVEPILDDLRSSARVLQESMNEQDLERPKPETVRQD